MKNIIIIEDEPEIAALIKDYLLMDNFKTDIFYDGITGLEAVLNNDYDLCILDVMLPGLDGFSVLRKLREKKLLPVIMLSARGEDVDKIRGLGLGADDYMHKPFSPGELMARVKAHLGRYERLTNAIPERSKLEIRDLIISREDRRVFKNNQEIFLTPKEFDILFFLAENPNRVYSREDLFEKIWGLEAIGDSGTVSVHIRKLREKLGGEHQDYVETVWGVGYRLSIDN